MRFKANELGIKFDIDLSGLDLNLDSQILEKTDDLILQEG